MELKNKKVLVTGGAVRLGAAICSAFASMQAKLVIHYRNSEQEAQALLESIGGTAAGHRLLKAELSNPDVAGKIIGEISPVDILVNNASVYYPAKLAEENIDNAQEQFAVNFQTPLALMCEFRKQAIHGSCIINILDQRVAKTIDDGSYGLSKKALMEAGIAAAKQWGPQIRVNAVAPGAVLPPSNMPKANMKKQIAEMPLQRPPETSDIAAACVFLAAADAITGQIIYVDSGQHL